MGAVLCALAYFGFWIDSHPIGQKTSGVVWVLVAAMLLSNFQITPFSSPIYEFVGSYMVALAIPLLLFKADVVRIFRESGKVIFTFAIASAGTVIGAVLGYHLLDLGDIGYKVAGVFTGGWVGGAVNFLAVSRIVEMTETEFSSAISASSVVSILALMILIVLPSVRWIVKLVPSKFTDTMSHAEKRQLREADRPKIRLQHLTGALAMSFAICAISGMIGNAIARPQYNILFVTLIAVIVGNLFPRAMRSLEGDFELGMIFMYLFFAVVGSGTDALAFVGTAMHLFVYGMLIIVIHLAIVLAMARLLKVDLAEAVIASGAALVGPAPTAAIAISQGWRTLVTPGIMCGIFGYVIGTFVGASVSALLR
jgi:uncharacterized membrane protein